MTNIEKEISDLFAALFRTTTTFGDAKKIDQQVNALVAEYLFSDETKQTRETSFLTDKLPPDQKIPEIEIFESVYHYVQKPRTKKRFVRMSFAEGGMSTLFLMADRNYKVGSLPIYLRQWIAKYVQQPSSKEELRNQRILKNEYYVLRRLEQLHINTDTDGNGRLISWYAFHSPKHKGIDAELLLPYISGGSLREGLSQSSLSIAEICQIGLYTDDALATAREHGFVHRDISPSNILLSLDPLRVTVADLGISLCPGVPPLDPEKVLIGKVHYMSPEQARCEQLSPESDIYVLASTIYSCLTGRPLHIAEEQLAVAYSTARNNPERIKEALDFIGDEFGPKAQEGFASAWQAKPRQRLIESFREGLQDILSREEFHHRLPPGGLALPLESRYIQHVEELPEGYK